MKTLLNNWFIDFCVVWLIFYLFRITHHPLHFLAGYLTDFLAVPVISNLGLWFQRIFIVKRSTYILKAGHVIFIVIYVSVVFEWLLPKYNPQKFTADFIDVILYILGGLFFFWQMNKPLLANGKNVRPKAD